VGTEVTDSSVSGSKNKGKLTGSKNTKEVLKEEIFVKREGTMGG